MQCEKKGFSGKVVEGHETGPSKKEKDRMRGNGSMLNNCKKNSQTQGKIGGGQEKDMIENNREHQEPTGVTKSTKKTRKPDREFYQPGSRRNFQGKDCGVGRGQDKPPRKQELKSDQESRVTTDEIEENKKTNLQKHGVQNKAKEVECIQENVKLSKSTETNRKQGNRDAEKPPSSSDTSVEILTGKVETLSMKVKTKVAGDATELSCKRGETTDKAKQGQGVGKKEQVEKKKERANRRRRGGEKEKERDWGENEVGGLGQNDQGARDKERDKRGAFGDKTPGMTGDRYQSKGKEKDSENKGDDNNNRSRENVKDAKADRNVERGDRNKSNGNITGPTSKRYSKSDIRRPRHRTYSSSSASSVTSLDGPRLGKDGENMKWTFLDPKHNNEAKPNSGVGQRRHLQSWTTNGESSTESMEWSETSDIAENRRRKKMERKEELSAERRIEERNRSRGNKGGSSGILRVSSSKHSGTSSRSGNVQQHRQGLVPRGRGGGILILPSCTDISKSPEVGQRLLFGGIRGGSAGRSRGGRGGGVRRLWDPNNPDQKPALSSTPSSQHSSLHQPSYLQTGTGYGQLHFLDTDDEIAGSPPVAKGEPFRSQQAAAMGYYKFQNSDNPYCYPVSTSNPQNLSGTTSSQRYPYPYHVGPYQMAPSNGMYTGPVVGQFCGSYRGTGYAQPTAGGSLTCEEVEQARGELGRLLRAADAQELQLSNLLSRDKVSTDGLDRMTRLR